MKKIECDCGETIITDQEIVKCVICQKVHGDLEDMGHVNCRASMIEFGTETSDEAEEKIQGVLEDVAFDIQEEARKKAPKHKDTEVEFSMELDVDEETAEDLRDWFRGDYDGS